MSIPKVLIVEDNKINQKVIEAILNVFETNIKIVDSGEEAVAEVQNDNFDLILIDFQLPKMSGVDAAILIRKYEKEKGSGAKSIIIALTAEVYNENRENCIKAGMDAFLTKPIR